MICNDCHHEATFWAHPPDEACNDLDCQTHNHGAQCWCCVQKFIDLIARLQLSYN